MPRGPLLGGLHQRPLQVAARHGAEREPQRAHGQVRRQRGGRQPEPAVHPAGPRRQQRERGAGDAQVRPARRAEGEPQPDRQAELPRQRRGGEEHRRLGGLPGHPQLGPYRRVVVRDLGGGPRDGRRVQADQGGGAALLGVVAVHLVVAQRAARPVGRCSRNDSTSVTCTQRSRSGSSIRNCSPVSGSVARSRACSRRSRAPAASASAVVP